jgi:hypothetical protein
MTKPQICNEIYKEISKKKENNKGCKNFKDNLKIINVEPLWQYTFIESQSNCLYGSNELFLKFHTLNFITSIQINL